MGTGTWAAMTFDARLKRLEQAADTPQRENLLYLLRRVLGVQGERPNTAATPETMQRADERLSELLREAKGGPPRS